MTIDYKCRWSKVFSIKLMINTVNVFYKSFTAKVGESRRPRIIVGASETAH